MGDTSQEVQTSDSQSLQDVVAVFSRLRRCASLASAMELGPDTVLLPTMDEERPKTRRVNPQRLALRLGPELVAEMEALIVPGAKMPTFAVRKDFQDRYCVDRRHIYDYFHSRGLRVAKEDKHTNLKRRKAIKNEQSQQSISPTPRLSMGNLLQVHSGHVLLQASTAGPAHEPGMPSPQLTKRAATYPGSLHAKRTKKATPIRYISPNPSFPPTPPSGIDILSASSSETGSFIQTSDMYSRPDGLDTIVVECHEQLSYRSSLSATEGFQESRREDLIPSLGSSWALDQCSNLYDLLDGEYSYVHDISYSTGPYQAQDMFAQSPGGSFSDFNLHSLGDGALETSVKTIGLLGNPVDDMLATLPVELPK